MAISQLPVSSESKDQLGWIALAALVLIIGGMAFYCYPFFFSSLSQNSRQIYTYSLDSMILLRDVQNSLHAHLFRLDFTDYGHLYYNLCIAATSIYAVFSFPGEGDIFFILRLMSFLGGVFTVLATYLFARRFLGTVLALFCAITIALTPAFLIWCLEPHPDSWQTFFVSLSVFLCCLAMPAASERGAEVNVRLLLGAAAAAGAAFSTKYIGVLLLPVLFAAALTAPIRDVSVLTAQRIMTALAIGAAVLVIPLLLGYHFLTVDRMISYFPRWRQLPPETFASLVLLIRRAIMALALGCAAIIAFRTFKSGLTGHRQIVMRLVLVLAILAIFGLTFVLTSPWSLAGLQFIPGVYMMGAYVNYGHGVKAAWYGWRWLSVLGGEQGIESTTAIFAALGVTAIFMTWKAQHFRVGAAPLVFAAGWGLLYMTFMIVRINLVKPYYLLPIVPTAAFLAAVGISALRHWLCKRSGIAASRAAVTAAILACIGMQAAFTMPVLAQYKKDYLPKNIAREKLAMADWLSRCVPRQTRIMTAAYSYIPTEFANAWLNTDQGGYNRLVSFQPSVVILNTDDINFYSGSLENSATNLLGNTDDKKRYFATVVHSPEWIAGPLFGIYRIYVTPHVRAAISRANRDCVRDFGGN